MKIKRIFVGDLHTNCYIVECEGETAVIDPGSDGEKILAHADGKPISKIFLTHGHFDHILAANYIKSKTGAKLYISEEDAMLLSDSEKNLYKEFSKDENGFTPVEADFFYNDTVKLGNTEFEVIKTPGHSSGSICLYADGELFSGDTLFAGSIGRTDRGNFDEIMHSLWKLMLLDDDVKVHPGHGFSTTIGKERNENPFLR